MAKRANIDLPERPSTTKARRKPDFATADGNATHPHIPTCPAWFWVFNQERWMIMDGKLVPSLHRTNFEPGVNHVEEKLGQDKIVRLDLSRTRAQIEKQGRRVVPYDWAPDGVSYLYCIETKPDGGMNVGEAWISVFESVDEGATETSVDEGAFATWLLQLVDEGKLPGCRVNRAKKMLSDARSRYETAAATAAKVDNHGPAKIRADAIALEIKVLETYLEGKATKPVAPTSKRTPDNVQE